MSDEAVAAVIAAAPNQAAVVTFRILAVTGARRAELAGLRWEDLVGDKLVISGQVMATPGPRRAGCLVLERRSIKTRQVCTVPLDPGTLAATRIWRYSLCEPAGRPGYPTQMWRCRSSSPGRLSRRSTVGAAVNRPDPRTASRQRT